jgi:anti-anti-sigma regulatory factor
VTPGPLRLDTWRWGDIAVVAPRGRLALEAFGQLRDHLATIGADTPRAVVVDLAGLEIESTASLSVFATAHTRLAQWPGVPMLVVSEDARRRKQLMSRRVPAHDTIRDAVDAVADLSPGRVTSTELTNELTSPRAARAFVRKACMAWGVADLVDDAALLIGELVSNTVVHTPSPSRLRIGLRRGLLSIAVYDDQPGEVCLRDPGSARSGVHGLLLVAQVATAWGCAQTLAGGKVVWATLKSVAH